MEPGKTYTYTIPKGLRTARGGVLVEEVKKTFTTNGHVRGVGASPWRTTVDQAAQDVWITFDQAVDHKSAQDRLRVSSGTVQSISWRGNTMVYSRCEKCPRLYAVCQDRICIGNDR